MTPLRTKRYIGGYRVIAPIGAGGFATVYRAINEQTGQEVAIKVLAENHSLVADTRRRFLAEIDLLRTVDSQAIAQIYEVGETETDQPFMVLELADRGDLRGRLEEIRSSHQVLGRAELALLAHHLYDSLTTLHRAEIVHRDVSPGNILIRSHQNTPDTKTPKSDGSVALLEPGERLLLADLGHAKDMIRASGFTAGGGTRGFTSPEQRDDITVVDLRADIFSATAVIEWAAHDGEYAEILEPFFDVGLAEDPADRFTSMTEWHAAFSASLSTDGGGAADGPLALGSMVDFAKEQAPTINRQAIGVAIAAVALGGMAAFVLAQLSSPNETGDTTTVAGVTANAPGNLSDETESSSDTDPLVVAASDGSPALGGTEPTAEILEPADDDRIRNDMSITGTAQGLAPGGLVRISVSNTAMEVFWNGEEERFQAEPVQFDVKVEQDEDDSTPGTWEYSIPAERLEPGLYLIRVWANGGDDNLEVEDDTHAVLVTS